MRDAFDPEFLSVAQVAELTGMHYRTVLRAVKARRLRAVRTIDGGVWRIHVDAYEAWLQGRQAPPLVSHFNRRSA